MSVSVVSSSHGDPSLTPLIARSIPPDNLSICCSCLIGMRSIAFLISGFRFSQIPSFWRAESIFFLAEIISLPFIKILKSRVIAQRIIVISVPSPRRPRRIRQAFWAFPSMIVSSSINTLNLHYQ